MASDKEINEAFRALSKRLHPDNRETGDEVKYKEISEAYTALKKSEAREKYDRDQKGQDSAMNRTRTARPYSESPRPQVITLIVETKAGKTFLTLEGKRISKEYDSIRKLEEGVVDFYIGTLNNQVDVLDPKGMFGIVEASYKSIEYRNGIIVATSLSSDSKSLLDIKTGREIIGGYKEFRIINDNVVGIRLFGGDIDILSPDTGRPISHNFKQIVIENGELVGIKWDGSKGVVVLERK